VLRSRCSRCEHGDPTQNLSSRTTYAGWTSLQGFLHLALKLSRLSIPVNARRPSAAYQSRSAGRMGSRRMNSQWTYAYASVIGSSHLKTGAPCQDASVCRLLQSPDGSNVLVAVVSDGAGSAEKAEEGSLLACNLFIDEIAALFECGEA